MSDAGLILLGVGGHASACIDVIELEGRYNIAGLIGTKEELGVIHHGYEVVGTDSDLFQLRESHKYAFVGVGQIGSPNLRKHISRQLLELDFELPTIISPYAHVSRYAEVGSGTIVMHGAIVNAGASIGSNCIINTRALIEHDVEVHDYSHVSTGAILNGNVVLGEGSFVGSGSVIREGVAIAANHVISMFSAIKE